MDQLASETEGYTGADIASLSSAAVMLALREHVSRYDDPKQADIHIQEPKNPYEAFWGGYEKDQAFIDSELDMQENIGLFGKPEVSIADKKEISEAGLA